MVRVYLCHAGVCFGWGHGSWIGYGSNDNCDVQVNDKMVTSEIAEVIIIIVIGGNYFRN